MVAVGQTLQGLASTGTEQQALLHVMVIVHSAQLTHTLRPWRHVLCCLGITNGGERRGVDEGVAAEGWREGDL